MSLFTNLDKKLSGLPDRSLTIALLLVGIFSIILAVYGTPSFKAAALVWMIAP